MTGSSSRWSRRPVPLLFVLSVVALLAEQDSGGPDLLVPLAIGCGAVAVLSAAAATVLLVRRRRAFRDLPTPPFGIPVRSVP